MLPDTNSPDTISKVLARPKISTAKNQKYEQICMYIFLTQKEEYIEYLTKKEIDSIYKVLDQEKQSKIEEIQRYEERVFFGIDLEKTYNLMKHNIENELVEDRLKGLQIYKKALKQYIKNIYKSENEKKEEFYINQLYNELYEECKEQVKNINITGMALNTTDTGKLLNKEGKIDFKLVEAFINIFYDKDLISTTTLIKLNKDKTKIYFNLQLLDTLLRDFNNIIGYLTQEVIKEGIKTDGNDIQKYLENKENDFKRKLLKGKLESIDKKFEKQLSKLDNPTEDEIEELKIKKENEKLKALIKSKSSISDTYDRKQKLEKIYKSLNKTNKPKTYNELNINIIKKLKKQINETIKENINVEYEQLKTIINDNIISKINKYKNKYIEQINELEIEMDETIDDYNPILRTIITSNNMSQIWLNENLIENLHLLILMTKIKESKIDKNLVFEFLDKKEQGKTRTEINNMLIEQINLKQKTIGGKNGL